MTAHDAIKSFQGPYRFLSNFYPCSVTLDGSEYRSVEYAYQAAKTVEPVYRHMIQMAHTSAAAKRLGRTVPLRTDWEVIKVGVMRGLLRDKFYRHEELRRALLATGARELIEGNTWGDTYWGVCRGQGVNMLGTLLMEMRAELQARERSPCGPYKD